MPGPKAQRFRQWFQDMILKEAQTTTVALGLSAACSVAASRSPHATRQWPPVSTKALLGFPHQRLEGETGLQADRPVRPMGQVKRIVLSICRA